VGIDHLDYGLGGATDEDGTSALTLTITSATPLLRTAMTVSVITVTLDHGATLHGSG